MARYTIAGFRGGETIITPSGDVKLHANDGAAELSADQITYFKNSGLTLTKAADTPPAVPIAPANPNDAEIAAALERGADQAAAATAAANARQEALDAAARAKGAPAKPTPSGV